VLDNLQHYAIDEPEAPIWRPRNGRLKSAGSRWKHRAVEDIENSDVHDSVWLLPPLFEFRIRDCHEPTFRVEPQRRMIIPDGADNRIARQAILRRQRLHLVILLTNQSAPGRDPRRSVGIDR